MTSDADILDAFKTLVTDPEADIPVKVTNRALFAVLANQRRAIDRVDTSVADNLKNVNIRFDEVDGSIDDIKNNHIPHLQQSFDDFKKDDFKQLKMRVEQNPSIMWLLRYQTSKTMKTLITIFVVLMVVAMLFWTVVPLRTLFLHWAGLPDNLLDSIIGITPIP